ncbi:MAG: sulfite exporter TauE/SafE family protein [Endozoicomonas sp.]|uniref:sulfite exporter TauE/SafE family protein n=1 Tax=Endozoicomonas sp. TaxID=1892382 RepID=UPI003D9BD006
MDSTHALLILAAFVTSAATAVLGAGGGVLLITLMPGLIPAAAIVPVHGVVQFFSNASRALFDWRNVCWHMWRRYLPGACIGAFLGSQVVLSINSHYIPMMLGIVILLMTWLPSLTVKKLPFRFLSFGVLHSFLATLAGATGPMAGAFLSREGLQRDALVTTVGVCMGTAHALKTVAFGVLGFNLLPYWELILWMSVSVILGSWVGTWIRKFLPEFSFKSLFRWLITLLALRLIGISLNI